MQWNQRDHVASAFRACACPPPARCYCRNALRIYSWHPDAIVLRKTRRDALSTRTLKRASSSVAHPACDTHVGRWPSKAS